MHDGSEKFTKSFTLQSPLPERSIQAAQEVLQQARLHRYGGTAADPGAVAELERAFAVWQRADYCLACASGGQALQIALRANNIRPGESVLTNAFTLAPVPGAIRAVGGQPILVEVTEDLVIDCDDLIAKATSSNARILLLSHMRGHLADMNQIATICKDLRLTLVEDCAHTMGATFDGIKSGNFGIGGCFSTQTYKHLNSGEGGFFTTNDPVLMARAIILSGSYMNFDRHGTPPNPSYFADAKYDCPNLSARMDNLRAAILLPQLENLDAAIEAWNDRCRIVETALQTLAPSVALPRAPAAAIRVGSSVQFRLPGLSAEQCLVLLDRWAARGVEVKWFGREEPAGFTSAHRHWRYIDSQALPRTDTILKTLFDLRLPLSFGVDDCHMLGRILTDEMRTLDEVAVAQ